MTQWLRLDSFKQSAPRGPSPDLVLDVVVSPYQIPEAVRGFRKGDHRFRIELRYIDGPEPAGDEVRIDDCVVGTPGRYSGRLLALEIDMRSAGASTVGLCISTAQQSTPYESWERALDAALASIAREAASRADYEHFRTSAAALRDREPNLVQQLAIAGRAGEMT